MSAMMIPMALKSAFAAMQTIAPTLSAAMSVGSAGVGYLSARGQAQAMQQANAEADERSRVNLIEDYDQVGKMQLQERASATQRQQENQQAGMKARAGVRAAAGEGGVSGLSIDALLGDLYGQEASIRDSVNQNLEGTTSQLDMERRGMQRGTMNQMASRPVAQKPSALAASFQAGSGVLQAYRHRFQIGDK